MEIGLSDNRPIDARLSHNRLIEAWLSDNRPIQARLSDNRPREAQVSWLGPNGNPAIAPATNASLVLMLASTIRCDLP